MQRKCLCKIISGRRRGSTGIRPKLRRICFALDPFNSGLRNSDIMNALGILGRCQNRGTGSRTKCTSRTFWALFALCWNFIAKCIQPDKFGTFITTDFDPISVNECKALRRSNGLNHEQKNSKDTPGTAHTRSESRSRDYPVNYVECALQKIALFPS